MHVRYRSEKLQREVERAGSWLGVLTETDR
jgi:hypothetical protein